jgi:hypothetical protein
VRTRRQDRYNIPSIKSSKNGSAAGRDEKGIMQFNASDLSSVSDKLLRQDPSMNIVWSRI